MQNKYIVNGSISFSKARLFFNNIIAINPSLKSFTSNVQKNLAENASQGYASVIIWICETTFFRQRNNNRVAPTSWKLARIYRMRLNKFKRKGVIHYSEHLNISLSRLSGPEDFPVFNLLIESDISEDEIAALCVMLWWTFEERHEQGTQYFIRSVRSQL